MSAISEAAERLAELLERENAALRRLDLPSAIAFLSEKRTALAELEQAGRASMTGAKEDPETRVAAIRLRDVSTENKKLLERAMAAQQHVMRLLAQAARNAAPSIGYGAAGGYAGRRADAAFALSSRA